MNYGLQVFNNDGIIQIDGLYKNLQLISVGTTTSGGAVTVGPDEVIAIRAAPGSWANVYTYNSAYLAGTPIATSTATEYRFIGNGTIYYYVFGYPSTDNGLFTVYDPSGVPVFSAGKGYMNVVLANSGYDSLSTTHYGEDYNGRGIASHSIPPEKTYAILPGVCTSYVMPHYAGDTVYIQVFSFSAGTINSYYTRITSYHAYIAQYKHAFYNYLILDVTGL
ncbi:hypothetical protein EV210_101146 [Anaerospora hongkongensis]|uniref:Uncharacterized protein n=1 Tax=Anaerospora hongkongensis TaxID=244830 RepID=A0A4R1Q383_9FIRM|nr:hypothetical protein [Anaerospora hongkongensis]TCL39948.1 hypothetical protein EV210_101146 [Anaerospora hongkongensis]